MDGFWKDELRKFGVVVGGVFAAIGAWLLIRRSGESMPGFVFAMMGAALILFGLAIPRLLRPVHKGWMAFALALGWINTRIILGALFYTAFLLARIMLFVFRKDPMERRLAADRVSYWQDIAEPIPERASYEHTF